MIDMQQSRALSTLPKCIFVQSIWQLAAPFGHGLMHTHTNLVTLVKLKSPWHTKTIKELCVALLGRLTTARITVPRGPSTTMGSTSCGTVVESLL